MCIKYDFVPYPLNDKLKSCDSFHEKLLKIFDDPQKFVRSFINTNPSISNQKSSYNKHA
jgi:hypothetical protein